MIFTSRFNRAESMWFNHLFFRQCTLNILNFRAINAPPCMQYPVAPITGTTQASWQNRRAYSVPRDAIILPLTGFCCQQNVTCLQSVLSADDFISILITCSSSRLLLDGDVTYQPSLSWFPPPAVEYHSTRSALTGYQSKLANVGT
jgi:hypothetical protein